jgi:hypothetical protein
MKKKLISLLIVFYTICNSANAQFNVEQTLRDLEITASTGNNNYWNVQNSILALNQYYDNNNNNNPNTGGCDNAGGRVDQCGNCVPVGGTDCTPPPPPNECGGPGSTWTEECGCIGGNTGRTECPPPCTYTPVSISWGGINYIYGNTTSACTTTLQPFTVTYAACADISQNVWRLTVTSITANVDIYLTNGGSRDPHTSPPVSNYEAINAISVMKAYYSNGGRDTWHTLNASTAHEYYHYSQFQCAVPYYWTSVQSCFYNTYTVPLNQYPDATSALTALMALNPNARVHSMRGDAIGYVVGLGDGSNMPPCAAGQMSLNTSIVFVQNLAAQNTWPVPSGVTSVTLPSIICSNTFASPTCQ